MTNVYRNPFIIAPPMSTCDQAYLVFGQGIPPYTVFPIASGDATGTSLEAIPVQASAGVLDWRVDFNAGANITFVVIDGRGVAGYSDYRVVQTQASTGLERCSKTVYGSSSSSTSIGGIVGGVLAAIVIILLGVLYYFLRKRKQKHLKTKYTSRSATPDSMRDRPAGLARAGTFNLHQIAFTEPSLDQLRAHDAPPTYVPGSQAEGECSRSIDSGLDYVSTGGDRAAEDRVGAGVAEARTTRDLL